MLCNSSPPANLFMPNTLRYFNQQRRINVAISPEILCTNRLTLLPLHCGSAINYLIQSGNFHSGKRSLWPFSLGHSLYVDLSDHIIQRCDYNLGGRLRSRRRLVPRKLFIHRKTCEKIIIFVQVIMRHKSAIIK